MWLIDKSNYIKDVNNDTYLYIGNILDTGCTYFSGIHVSTLHLLVSKLTEQNLLNHVRNYSLVDARYDYEALRYPCMLLEYSLNGKKVLLLPTSYTEC